MGLIKATVGAIKSTLGDQFLTGIKCDDMGNSILMKKVTNPDGIIANGSRIIVAPGQVAAIYDNGKIVDATAEEGVYTFKTDAAPSFFGGNFGGVFKDMWDRFKFGGAAAKEQAVYFFNIKEIIDNKFGTQNPVPYRDWGHPLTNPRTNTLMPMSVAIKCFGKYTFKLADPALFMSQIAGSKTEYRKEELVEQIRAEVIGAFVNVMNSLGEDEYKIEALSIPNKTDEIKTLMDEQVFDAPIRNRGITLISFIVESVTLDDESKDKINQYEMGSDAYQQKAVLTDAYAEAIKNAASNDAGAMNGFIGVGMTNMGSGNAFAGIGGFGTQTSNGVNPENKVYEKVETNKPINTKNVEETPTEQVVEEAKQVEEKSEEWGCECGVKTNGNFCPNCGRKRPEGAKKCPTCGNKIEEGSKFCPECGTKL